MGLLNIPSFTNFKGDRSIGLDRRLRLVTGKIRSSCERPPTTSSDRAMKRDTVRR